MVWVWAMGHEVCIIRSRSTYSCARTHMHGEQKSESDQSAIVYAYRPFARLGTTQGQRVQGRTQGV